MCDSEHKAEVEVALTSGEPIRAVAKRYGLGRMAISRHRDNHLSPAIAEVVEERQKRGAAKLVDRLEGLVKRAERLMDHAEHGHKLVCPSCKTGVVVSANSTAALAAMRELRANLELLGKVTGELDSRPVTVINLATVPEWLRVRTAMMEELALFPEARLAVARRLRVVDAA